MGLGSSGVIITVNRQGPDAQRGVARRVLDQKLKRLHARRVAIGDLLWRLNWGLADAVPAARCGEGVP
ncbi:hypothetical protein GWE18_38875 [Bradyrhizobium sp. CSA112]|uniref:hypothetical protein n=1 Tax=Bradyrhizobium sp. CSA112 TaxID=2699170 RepID=UPI0023B04007|nr:hypothetical protein [Bradyrhizobium sp. CSA112]MDE5458635.1 hypothetical protein [Bradyrhizobium sp. CSA112]